MRNTPTVFPIESRMYFVLTVAQYYRYTKPYVIRQHV